jgi:hypothetical protein
LLVVEEVLSVLVRIVPVMQLGERVRLLFEPRDAAAQAEKTFRSLWKKTARAGSTRHPFHREVLTDLGMPLDQVNTTPPATLVLVRDIPTRWDLVERLYPYIARRLTRTGCAASSLPRCCGRRLRRLSDGAIAGLGWHRSRVLTVQHRISGLRAAFL